MGKNKEKKEDVEGKLVGSHPMWMVDQVQAPESITDVSDVMLKYAAPCDSVIVGAITHMADVQRNPDADTSVSLYTYAESAGDQAKLDTKCPPIRDSHLKKVLEEKGYDFYGTEADLLTEPRLSLDAQLNHGTKTHRDSMRVTYGDIVGMCAANGSSQEEIEQEVRQAWLATSRFGCRIEPARCNLRTRYVDRDTEEALGRTGMIKGTRNEWTTKHVAGTDLENDQGVVPKADERKEDDGEMVTHGVYMPLDRDSFYLWDVSDKKIKLRMPPYDVHTKFMFHGETGPSFDNIQLATPFNPTIVETSGLSLILSGDTEPQPRCANSHAILRDYFAHLGGALIHNQSRWQMFVEHVEKKGGKALEIDFEKLTFEDLGYIGTMDPVALRKRIGKLEKFLSGDAQNGIKGLCEVRIEGMEEAYREYLAAREANDDVAIKRAKNKFYFRSHFFTIDILRAYEHALLDFFGITRPHIRNALLTKRNIPFAPHFKNGTHDQSIIYDDVAHLTKQLMVMREQASGLSSPEVRWEVIKGKKIERVQVNEDNTLIARFGRWIFDAEEVDEDGNVKTLVDNLANMFHGHEERARRINELREKHLDKNLGTKTN